MSRHMVLFSAGMCVAAVLTAVAAYWHSGQFRGRDVIYLTWQDDPATTLVVHYHTRRPGPSVVRYGPQSTDGHRGGYPHVATGSHRWVVNRYVHTVALSGLTPGEIHHFMVGEARQGFHSEQRFRTPPEQGPLRFIAAGDMGYEPIVGRLVAAAAATDPMFMVVGGDLAYADGDPRKISRWDRWLGHWTRNARTPDGVKIPIIAGIGNHEVNRLAGTPEERAPMYLGFFEQGGLPYFTRVFGDRLALILLDSGHLYPHAAQAAWLAAQLEATRGAAFQVPVYHVPLYPANRGYLDDGSVAGRTHWLPLFDAHGVRVAFEHHDHLFKRTHPLRGDALDPDGAVYLGDGAFGVEPRLAMNRGHWYMARAEERQHFWLVDLDGAEMHCVAMDETGAAFDAVTIKARPALLEALPDAA